MKKVVIQLSVNGKPVRAEMEPRVSLADFLREDLRLTGTHVGCEHGVCGVCTILVNGKSARACLMFAAQADGLAIVTVEGLAPEGELNELQAAFRRHHALQCGFCTPGMLCAATDLLERCPSPTPDEVRDALSGNVCRCTGYVPIVDAVLDAAAKRGRK